MYCHNYNYSIFQSLTFHFNLQLYMNTPWLTALRSCLGMNLTPVISFCNNAAGHSTRFSSLILPHFFISFSCSSCFCFFPPYSSICLPLLCFRPFLLLPCSLSSILTISLCFSFIPSSLLFFLHSSTFGP